MDYTTLAPQEVLPKVIDALKARNIEATVVADKAEALAQVKALIPAGASVMNGTSTTLQQIGYVDYLKAGQHGWINLHEGILAEKDPTKQALLRKQAVLSDYYLGSVHALTEGGELLIGSNSGSQLPHIVYTSPNVVFVVSTTKVVSTLADAERRLLEHVVPLEDQRMKSTGAAGTKLNKKVTFYGEPTYTGRKIHLILVKEPLGF